MSLFISQLVGFMAAVAEACSCVTSYVTGDRTASITVTTNITWDAGTDDNLVDGGFGLNSTDSVDTPGTGSTAVADGSYVRFDYGGAPKYVDEATIYKQTAGSIGNWKWQGSKNGTDWLDLASFTWNAATEVTAFTTNLDSYQYYRMFENDTGINWPNEWFEEVEFKQCTC